VRNPIAILGIPIDDLNTEKTLERLDEFVASQRFHQVATANTDFLIQALDDPELKSILWTADLVVPDGMPIVLASKWLGMALKERVSGADLVPLLAARAAAKGYKIFLLGGRLENTQKARERLLKENPGLQIVGCLSPPPSHLISMDHEAILAEIEAAAPDILLVAFGNPKQEKWIHLHRERLQVPVCIGVGGTLDFLAGATVRAPEWMQKSGLEWFHRLAHEPKRLWRRYTKDIVQFSKFISLQLWTMRRRRITTEARITEVVLEDCTVLSLVGSLDASLVRNLQWKANQALNNSTPTHLILDLQATTDLDSAILGTLLNLPKRAAFVDREVRLVGVPPHLRSILNVSQTQSRLKVYPTFADALRGESVEALDIVLSVESDRAVLILEGHADEKKQAELERHLRQLPPGIMRIDLDLNGVTFLDTGILTLLHKFADAKKKSGCNVRLLPGSTVRSLLTREKLTSVFELG
jgi:N-acetylglucosaminyldiphosphoundecaprenol N-acetyl-beta-D-mannosaminyltransferase